MPRRVIQPRRPRKRIGRFQRFSADMLAEQLDHQAKSTASTRSGGPMADSARQFSDDVITTKPYEATRPVDDISGSGFRTGAADARAYAAAG